MVTDNKPSINDKVVSLILKLERTKQRIKDGGYDQWEGTGFREGDDPGIMGFDDEIKQIEDFIKDGTERASWWLSKLGLRLDRYEAAKREAAKREAEDLTNKTPMPPLQEMF